MKNTTWIAVAVIVILLGGWLIVRHNNSDSYGTIASSTDYTTTPNPDLVKTAQQVPAIGSLATKDDIVVTKPKEGDIITSPVSVTGTARGSWFFEATAPVLVIDTNGKTLGKGTIKPTGNAQTAAMVPFTGTITFTTASDTPTTGAIVFLNDNPSGQASTSRFTAIPIYFQAK